MPCSSGRRQAELGARSALAYKMALKCEMKRCWRREKTKREAAWLVVISESLRVLGQAERNHRKQTESIKDQEELSQKKVLGLF